MLRTTVLIGLLLAAASPATADSKSGAPGDAQAAPAVFAFRLSAGDLAAIRKAVQTADALPGRGSPVEIGRASETERGLPFWISSTDPAETGQGLEVQVSEVVGASEGLVFASFERGDKLSETADRVAVAIIQRINQRMNLLSGAARSRVAPAADAQP